MFLILRQWLVLTVLLAAASPAFASSSCQAIFAPSIFYYTTNRAEIRTLLMEKLLVPSHDFLQAENVADSLLRLDERTRDAWVKTMIEHYRDFPKLDLSSGHPRYAGRRFIDRILFRVLSSHERMRAEISSGVAPWESYSRYLNAMSVRFDSEYDANLVREVLGEMHRELKSVKGSFYVREFFVGGSLINGRANIRRSDIDIVNHMTLKQGQEQRLRERIQESMRSVDGAAYATLEFHPNMPSHVFGALHPVAFRVTDEAIELLIYEPPPVKLGVRFGFDVPALVPIETHSLPLNLFAVDELK